MNKNTLTKLEEIDANDSEKRFIVVCESWEYNDEYYFQPEDEGYTLHEPKLYTKQEADILCQKLNKHSSDHLTRWDDDMNQEVKIQPYKIIKLDL